MKKTLILATVLTVIPPAIFAEEFSDVPKTHWAYPAVQQAVNAGVMQGFGGKFHGEKFINRYQMAVIVKKILKARGGNNANSMAADDLRNLEQLTIEFADELALLNVKIRTLEDSFIELNKQVARLSK